MNTQSTAELLARVDERTKFTAQSVDGINKKLDAHDERLGNVETAVTELLPVKQAVFASIGLILTAVIVAVLAVVLTRPVTPDTRQLEQTVNKAIQQALQPANK